jgi:ABC-type glycerol-3-phosphate transport system substrate-binding protein
VVGSLSVRVIHGCGRGGPLAVVTAVTFALTIGCGPRPDVLTFSGSVLGAEGDAVRRQIARFEAEHGVPVEVRPTPDSADQRHQLYVQWLNAWSAEPDVLQLDVVWTPEFAAAGWIRPLDDFGLPPAEAADFFTAPIIADRWQGRLYAIPWFVDVGMLYWRTDLMPAAPETFAALDAIARRAIADGSTDSGFVWQGARYEGLVTVFLEYLAGYGGVILDARGRVVVDSPAAVQALAAMGDSIHRDGIVPKAVLTWQEEQTRFAFQNGHATFMRNWPYAAALLAQPDESAVAGHFAVAAMPRANGRPAAALGGAQLAINSRSRQPAEAWALITYLTAPAQMLERAVATGQFPARRGVYDNPALASALPVSPAQARAIIERAVPRPVTPVYTQLSGILQIHVHRALTRQEAPAEALSAAAAEMRTLLQSFGLENPAS